MKKIKRVRTKKINWLRLILAVLLCETAGVVGSIFTFSSIPTWYLGLIKPSFSPPNYLFGPVWTLLYALMGISLYLVWQKKVPAKVFYWQLLANSLWSIIFFGFKNIPIALVEIVVLWTLIVITIIKFYKVSKLSGILLIPYLLWVSFASFLNYSLWILNR